MGSVCFCVLGSGRWAGAAMANEGILVKIVPKWVNVVAPSDGNQDNFKITITNLEDKMLTYKMRGTKLARFTVHSPYGFIGPLASHSVDLKAKAFSKSDGLNEHDHFTFLFAFSPPGTFLNARDVWQKGSKLEPNKPKRKEVKIVYVTDDEQRKMKENLERKKEEVAGPGSNTISKSSNTVSKSSNTVSKSSRTSSKRKTKKKGSKRSKT